jgi:hypothetical protein
VEEAEVDLIHHHLIVELMVLVELVEVDLEEIQQHVEILE